MPELTLKLGWPLTPQEQFEDGRSETCQVIWAYLHHCNAEAAFWATWTWRAYAHGRFLATENTEMNDKQFGWNFNLWPYRNDKHGMIRSVFFNMEIRSSRCAFSESFIQHPWNNTHTFICCIYKLSRSSHGSTRHVCYCYFLSIGPSWSIMDEGTGLRLQAALRKMDKQQQIMTWSLWTALL